MPDLWDILTKLVAFFAALTFVVVAVEAVTEILVTSKLLDIIGLRPWASRKALPEDGDLSKVRWYNTAFFKLLTCGYCCSVWVAGAFAWFLPGGYFGLLPWDNIVVKIFLAHRLSNYWHVRYELARRGRVNTLDLEVKLKVDDAREVPGGDGAPGAPPDGQDLRVPVSVVLGGHQAPAGGTGPGPDA